MVPFVLALRSSNVSWRDLSSKSFPKKYESAGGLGCAIAAKKGSRTGQSSESKQRGNGKARFREPRKGLILIASFALLFTPLASFSQAAGDVAPFSAIENHGLDSINLQNLTAYLNIGIRQKAGAIPFSYSIMGDSWCNATGPRAPHVIYCGISPTAATGSLPLDDTAWAPVDEPGGLLGAAAWYTLINTHGTCPNGSATTILSGWVITNVGGTSHPLPIADYIDTAGCLNQSLTDVAVNDSGLGVSVAYNNYTHPTVFTKHGIYATNTTSETDPNGNTMSLASAYPINTYTDTLGVTALTAQYINSNGPGSPGTYTWKDANNNLQTVAVNVTPETLKTAFACGAPFLDSDSTGYDQTYLVTSISYPDGSTVGLEYEPTPGGGGYTGRIASITLRTGGNVSYQYLGAHNGIDCTWLVPDMMTRTTQDGTTTYTWVPLCCVTINGGPLTYGNTTTVLDPGGNKTVYTFTWGVALGYSAVHALTQVQTYQNTGTVLNPSYALLSTDLTCYNGNSSNCASAQVSYPITEKDVYHTINGMSTASRTQTEYDKYGNITYSAQYDFGATTPTMATSTTYGTWNGSACVAIGNYVYDRPCDAKTTDGAATPNTLSETRYTYDAHGNLLTKSVWTGTTWLNSSYTYNGNGTVNTFTDVNQTQATQWSYSYAPTGSGGCNGLFLTQSQITVATGDTLTTKQTWNCDGGVLLTSADANGNATTYGYTNSSGIADPFWRVSSVSDPTGYTSYTNYTPTTVNNHASFNLSVEDTTTYKDGLGRPVLTQTEQGPSSPNYDSISTSYTWNGTVFQTGKSTPCVQAQGLGCQSNFTNSTVDPLLRLVSTQDPLGGSKVETYSLNDASVTAGPAPAGEHVKSTQIEYDGLGRAKSICQVLTTGGSSCGQSTAASGYLTSYSYGTFTGGTSKTSTRALQTRTLIYDALGRLTLETHPETGTVQYFWDAAPSACGSGGWATPGDLGAKKDNAGVYVCYGYDALHRLVGWKNTKDTTCGASIYDLPQGSLPTGVTISNGAGREIEAYTNSACNGKTSMVTDEYTSYDADGRIAKVYESTLHSGGYYSTTAQYQPNGALLALSGIPGYGAMNYGLDGEGRLTSAQYGTVKVVCDTTCSQASTTYNAAGQPLVVNIFGTGSSGSGDNDTYTYDATGRMSAYTFTVGATPKSMGGALMWNANGTLRQLAITDGFNGGGTQTCTYGTSTVIGYDDLGRLLNVNCSSAWQQTFSYDQYDNITKTGSASWACAACYNTSTNQYNSTLSTQISYDPDGNVLNDTFHQYNWDGYGHPVTIAPATGSGTCGTSGITCVTYDAHGRAVEENTGGVYTEILYSPLGKTAIMSSQTTSSAYIPLPAGETAYLSGSTGGTMAFWHKDWLGTVRLSTGVQSRNMVYDRAFAPYGEMYKNFGSTTGLDFTGDTQDIVSGTFDTPNRELNPSQGRWISPDPSRAGWNLYAYATDPNTGTDPTGLWVDQDWPIPEFGIDGVAGWNGMWAGRGSKPATGWGDPSSPYPSGDSGVEYPMLWVTTTRNATDSSSGSSNPQSDQAPAQDQIKYTTTILGQKVPVTITGGTAEDRLDARKLLDADIANINEHAAELDKTDIKLIHNIKKLEVSDWEDFVDVKTGSWKISMGYLSNPGTSAAWFGTMLVHEGYHVEQYQRGEVYSRANAFKMENAASRAAIHAGTVFGLDPQAIEYLRNDQHSGWGDMPPPQQ